MLIAAQLPGLVLWKWCLLLSVALAQPGLNLTPRD